MVVPQRFLSARCHAVLALGRCNTLPLLLLLLLCELHAAQS